MLPKIECSDELLLGILNQDSGGSTELGLQHLDECEYCQARIEDLAANQRQWTLAREGLCSRVEGGLDIGNDFQNPTPSHPIAEQSSDWTDTMAKQFLQPPSHPEMLGRLGRYEIERLVGSGGMGVVFKAYDSELHRSVAIKMLAPHLSGSRSARERFAREARAAAAIVNDHVVPIHNVETEHATPYLVMQYIAGHSLQARLDRDGPLEVCEILRIGMQVANGLAAAHAQGLIHRDVKPLNIMLDENVARALLTDFGLARTQDETCLTRSGFHPGTPHYMSPEQVRGEELDGRSDLFSLGCVLYALCTGHPPYRADSGYAVMRRITDEQPRSIREQNALIPEWLERVVMRLLEKDREARFQSAEELAQILEQCLAHVQKPATEPLPLAVVPGRSFFDRWRIRNWILAGMAGAFLFFAGVLIVLETNKGTITIKSEADNVPIRIKRSDKVVAKQLQLDSLGAFAVAFDANGSVWSARFRHLIAPGFSDACGQLEVVDLKGVVEIRKSLQELTRLKSLRMVILNESDVRDEDIQLLTQIPGLKHIWMTNTKLTDQCVDDLARIEPLEIVKLDETEISAEGVERLRLLKPKLKIEGGTRAE
jgi:serine/threonine protein kinase